MNKGGAKIKAKTRGRRDPADETAEITRVATDHGVTPVQAKNLLARFGSDRVSLDAAAQRLKVPSH